MLVGADDVEKAAVAGEFAGLVEEGLEAFNIDRLYGGDIKVDAVIDASQTLPMMAPRRVVVILEAEKLLMPKREGKSADEEQARLEAFIENPPDHATVVFVCGPLDMRRRVPKLLARQAQVVDCGTIENDADADLWVKTRAARDKINLEPAAIRALVERAGLDIVRLRSALERVALYAMGQPTVTVDDVRQVVAAGPQARRGLRDRECDPERRCVRSAAPAWRVARRRRRPVRADGTAAVGGRKDATATRPAFDRRGVPDRPRLEIVRRRSADPARAAGGGTVWKSEVASFKSSSKWQVSVTCN